MKTPAGPSPLGGQHCFASVSPMRGVHTRKISESILYAATIKVEDASSNSVKLIIHELGHALGIEHSHHDRGHIMHPHVMDEDTRFE